MHRIILIIVFIFIAVSFSKAQEMWGISNSNFAGNMGIFLNPTTIVGAPYNYEINLAAIDIYADNSNIYFFSPKKTIYHSFIGYGRDYRNFFTREPAMYKSTGHQLIIGPSYIRNKTSYAWGLHSALRSEVSTIDMSPELALIFADKYLAPILYGDTFNSPGFKSAYASWIELGGTYGSILHDEEHHLIKWAITGNLLVGMNSFYAKNTQLNFIPVNSSQISFLEVDQTYSHAMNDDGESVFGFHGMGLSTTAGLVYINHPDRGAFECNMSNDKKRKYKYRLGASILDLGTIYNFVDSKKVDLNTTLPRSWNGIDTFAFAGFEQLDTTLAKSIGGEIKNQNFLLWLPIGASIQFDYQVRPNLFANLSWVNRLHFFPNEIARANQLTASVRYERRRFEANLNYSMYEYKRSTMGLAFRYRFFVIGTDRLLQTLGMAEQKSFDLFIGLKFQFCKKPFSPGPDCPAYLSN
jgi:hypothetical protein